MDVSLRVGYHARMFDTLKQLKDLPGMLSRAKEMQEKMKQLQEELGRRQFTADAGAGMVTATVSGKLELIKLKVDPIRLGLRGGDAGGKFQVTAGDIEMLEDLSSAAIRAAQAKAGEAIQTEMGKLASDIGLPAGALPGL
jgi:nucleoid-associated protein EbfC